MHVGALIPNTFKIVIPLGVMSIHTENFFMPLHLPIGSLIIASFFTLFFRERKKLVLSLLVLGVTTHYALDLLLINLNRGMELLFPFSWNSWAINVVPNDAIENVVKIENFDTAKIVDFCMLRIFYASKIKDF